MINDMMSFLTWLAWCFITLKLVLSIFIVIDILFEPDCLQKLSSNEQAFSKRDFFRRSRGRGLKIFGAHQFQPLHF